MGQTERHAEVKNGLINASDAKGGDGDDIQNVKTITVWQKQTSRDNNDLEISSFHPLT